MFCSGPQNILRNRFCRMLMTVFVVFSVLGDTAECEYFWDHYGTEIRADIFAELRNPCISFRDVQKDRNDFSVKSVKILGTDEYGETTVIILGVYVKLEAVLEGISLTPYRSNIKHIICDGKMSGTIVRYNTASLGISGGKMTVEADGMTDVKTVIIRQIYQ